MSSHSGSEGPDGVSPAFGCVWSATGVDAAAVRLGGELDVITAPQVTLVLREALEHARLVVIDVHELSFVDSCGVHVFLDATRQARDAGARLVLVGASAELERVFVLTGTRGLVDMLAGAPAAKPVLQDAVPRTPSPVTDGRRDPLKNPVNAGIVTARVMDIADRALWTHSRDGSIRRAWAPAAAAVRVPAGTAVEVYLDRRGAINGWWHRDSGLAINQRRLAADADPESAAGLACQGPCGLVWRAPAAAELLDHDEHCLTCAGDLALL